MINKIVVFIIHTDYFFNLEKGKTIEHISDDYKSTLFKALLNNHFMNLNKYKTENQNIDLDIVLCYTDEISYEIDPEDNKYHKHFITEENFWLEIGSIAKKYFVQDQTAFMFVFTKTMGLGPSKIHHMMNLLNYDDNTIVCGLSKNHSTTLFSMNFYSDIFFERLNTVNPDLETFIKYVNEFDVYVFTVNKFMKITDLDEFKDLYNQLSKKESIEYCSHKIHHQIIPLFIEYKELLQN